MLINQLIHLNDNSIDRQALANSPFPIMVMDESYNIVLASNEFYLQFDLSHSLKHNLNDLDISYKDSALKITKEKTMQGILHFRNTQGYYYYSCTGHYKNKPFTFCYLIPFQEIQK